MEKTRQGLCVALDKYDGRGYNRNRKATQGFVAFAHIAFLTIWLRNL